jgi:hypothetical protein
MAANPGNGPKYTLNIEGNEIPWDQDTITTEQIAKPGMARTRTAHSSS